MALSKRLILETNDVASTLRCNLATKLVASSDDWNGIDYDVDGDDFLEDFTYKVEGHLSLLPPGVVWASSNLRTMIVRDQPSIKTLYYNVNSSKKQKNTVIVFTIKTPSLLYGIVPINNEPLVHSVHSLKATKENPEDGTFVYDSCLPNIYAASGNVCTHHYDFNDSPDDDSSYIEKVSRAIGEFWGGNFNSEVNEFLKSRFFKLLDLAYQTEFFNRDLVRRYFAKKFMSDTETLQHLGITPNMLNSGSYDPRMALLEYGIWQLFLWDFATFIGVDLETFHGGLLNDESATISSHKLTFYGEPKHTIAGWGNKLLELNELYQNTTSETKARRGSFKLINHAAALSNRNIVA